MKPFRKLFRKHTPKIKRPYWKKRGFWAIVLCLTFTVGPLSYGKLSRHYQENQRQQIAEAIAQAQLQMQKSQPLVQVSLVEAVPEPETPALLQQRCMAHTIDGEARGEKFEGKLAVAYVMFNRYTKSGNTPCTEVCKAGQFDGATKACNGGAKSARPSDEAMDIAYKVMTGEYKAEGCLKGAMYFMNPHTSSYKGAMWILKDTEICLKIGNHVFATDKPVKPVTVAQAKSKHAKKKPVAVAQVKTEPPAVKLIKLASKK